MSSPLDTRDSVVMVTWTLWDEDGTEELERTVGVKGMLGWAEFDKTTNSISRTYQSDKVHISTTTESITPAPQIIIQNRNK